MSAIYWLLRRLFDWISHVWSEFRHLLIVLWLCRISTLSAGLGLIAAFLPQAQDLYTEIPHFHGADSQSLMRSVTYWGLFYLFAFLWAFTVHYTARTILSFETWPLKTSDERKYAHWLEAVPRYLGWVCIIAIFIGQINALWNLHYDGSAKGLPSTLSYIVAMAVILIFLVIRHNTDPQHRVGRNILFISFASLFYLGYATNEVFSIQDMNDQYKNQVIHNLTLPAVTIVWGCCFYWFVARRRRLLKSLAKRYPSLHKMLQSFTAKLAHYFPVRIWPLYDDPDRQEAPKFLPFRKRSLFRFEAAPENVRGLMFGLLSLSVVIIVWAFFAFSPPTEPPLGIQRILLLPLLLAIWVPVLTIVSFLSNQLRFPFLTSFVIFGILVSWLWGDNHDVSIMRPDLYADGKAPRPSKQEVKANMALKSMPRQSNHSASKAYTKPLNAVDVQSDEIPQSKIPLQKAVHFWMKQHNCADDPLSCPPPVIIAASGGASRSSFYVATVLGYMHDNPHLFWPKRLPVAWRPRLAEDVSKHIFAISSVSGGSTASAFYTASLKGDSEKNYGNLPCHPTALRQDDLLFSIPTKPSQKANYKINWTHCLQALAAGDFLSPVFISFAFRDNLALSSLLGLMTKSDRAIALEEAWYKRYNQLTGNRHLKDPLLSFQPTEKRWLPLPIHNSTSVSTGKRLIATPLAAVYEPNKKLPAKNRLTVNYFGGHHVRNAKKSAIPLFPDSLDLHDLINLNLKAPPKAPPPGETYTYAPHDISLVKSASLSARFPLISPHGNLINKEGKIIDRVVDGGYFDNSGMLSAMELAQAMKTVTRGALRPLVVQISNDPVTFQETHKTKKCASLSIEAEREYAAQKKILPELNSILGALLNARVARGTHAVAQAAQTGDARFPHYFVHFQVIGQKDEFGTNKNLSMSWWLSKSVQQSLHNQMKTPLTRCSILAFRKALTQHAESLGPGGTTASTR